MEGPASVQQNGLLDISDSDDQCSEINDTLVQPNARKHVKKAFESDSTVMSCLLRLCSYNIYKLIQLPLGITCLHVYICVTRVMQLV